MFKFQQTCSSEGSPDSCRQMSWLQRSLSFKLRCTAESRQDLTHWHFILTSANGCVSAPHLQIWWKKTARTREQPSVSSLKVTDCFPSETFEPLSFLSRPVMIEDLRHLDISKEEIVIFRTSFVVSESQEQHCLQLFHLTFKWYHSAILISFTEMLLVSKSGNKMHYFRTQFFDWKAKLKIMVWICVYKTMMHFHSGWRENCYFFT